MSNTAHSPEKLCCGLSDMKYVQTSNNSHIVSRVYIARGVCERWKGSPVPARAFFLCIVVRLRNVHTHPYLPSSKQYSAIETSRIGSCGKDVTRMTHSSLKVNAVASCVGVLLHIDIIQAHSKVR